jgi:hypothetical protein
MCVFVVPTHCFATHFVCQCSLYHINVQFKSQDGTTTLIIAANNNNLEIVKVLLNAKAEVNVLNKVSESDGV